MGTRMALPAAPGMLPVGSPCAAKSMPPAMMVMKTEATVPPSAAMSLMPSRATTTLIIKPTQTFPLSFSTSPPLQVFLPSAVVSFPPP